MLKGQTCKGEWYRRRSDIERREERGERERERWWW
jgi:hypothetical protein